MQKFKLILAVLLVAVGVWLYVTSEPKNANISLKEQLSDSSLERLKQLNEQYGLVSVRDLKAVDAEVFKPSFLKADVLSVEKSANNLGIITRISVPEEDLLLSWQPEKALSEEELKEVARRFEAEIPEVQIAEVDQNVEILNLYDVTGAERKLAAKRKERGSVLSDGVPVVAIVDSGIYRYHRDFDKARVYEKNGVRMEWNFATNSANASDVIGHGTHVTGIIHESSDAKLMILNIFDPKSKSSKLSYILAALTFARKNGADVVNLSLGIRQDSHLLQEMVREMYEDDIAIVAGAGNDNRETLMYPARYSEVISVASLNGKGDKSILSSYGSWIDYSANGEDVYSFKNAKSGYRHMSGTSQAAAVVTAKIAKIIETEKVVSVKQLRKILDQQAQAFSKLAKKYKGLLGKGVIELD